MIDRMQSASSSERKTRTRERELDLFPLVEIELGDVILARTFQGADCQMSKLLFAA